MVACVTALGAYDALACNVPTGATVSTTAITCRGTGKITVSDVMDGATPIPVGDCSFALYDAANTNLIKPFQSSEVLTGLDAGNYTLRIHQNCSGSGISADYWQSVTITGSYTDPVLSTPVITAPTCSNNGIITATASKGYGAYEYCLVDSLNSPAAPATYVSPRQSSGVFTGMAPGDYYVRVYDACNGFVTTKVTVPQGVPATNPIGNLVKNGEDCNLFKINVNFTRFVPRDAYTIWWQYPDGTYDTLKTSTYPGNEYGWSVPKSKIPAYPGVVTLFFKNECGVTFSQSITLNQPSWQIAGILSAAPYSCTQGSYTMNAAYWEDMNNGNIGGRLYGSWDEYSLDGGTTWIPYNGTDTILVDKGSSRTVLYKVCGQVYTANIAASAGLRTLAPVLSTSAYGACNGNGTIQIDLSGNPYNGSPNKLIVKVISQPAAQPPIPDFVAGHRTRSMMNLVPGSYTLLFTDECGATATRTITVPASVQTVTAAPVYTCGSSKVGITLVFNTSVGTGDNLNYQIFNSNNVMVVNRGVYLGGLSFPWSKTITNLDPDVYTIRVWRSDVSNNILSQDTICPVIVKVDARTPGSLSLNKSVFAICTNDLATGMIAAMPQGGVPPYKYTLFKGSVTVGNQVGAEQSSNIFTGLDVNEPYIIAVTDQCGAGSTYSNVFANLKPVISASSPLVPCPGDAITFSVGKNPGLYYQWTRNGTDIAGATDTAYAINSVQASDSGVYQVKITANSCLMLSRETSINPDICGVPFALPIDLVSFTGKVNVNGHAVLHWNIAQPEPGGKFEVLYSTNGKNYQPAGTLFQEGTKTTFDFTHGNYTIQGKVFYKLLMTEADGKLKHSNVLPLSNGSALQENASLSAAPVPFDNVLTVQYTASQAGPVQIAVTDINGRVVLSQPYETSAGSNAIMLNGLGTLRNGVYMLSVSDKAGNKQAVKIVK